MRTPAGEFKTYEPAFLRLAQSFSDRPTALEFPDDK